MIPCVLIFFSYSPSVRLFILVSEKFPWLHPPNLSIDSFFFFSCQIFDFPELFLLLWRFLFHCALLCFMGTVSPPTSLRILIIVILKFPLPWIYFCFLWGPLIFLFYLCFSFWRFFSNGHWSCITVHWYWRRRQLKAGWWVLGMEGPTVELHTARAGGELPPQDAQAVALGPPQSHEWCWPWPGCWGCGCRTGHHLWIRLLFITLPVSALCSRPPFPVSHPASWGWEWICGFNTLGAECQLSSPQHSPSSMAPGPSTAGDPPRFCEWPACWAPLWEPWHQSVLQPIRSAPPSALLFKHVMTAHPLV